MEIALSAIGGVVVGAALIGVILLVRRRPAEDIARRLVEQVQDRHARDLDSVISQVKDAFGALSREALSGNSNEFLKLAKSRLDEQTSYGVATLDSKKKLIDASLESLNGKVNELNRNLHTSEKQRRESFGRLMQELSTAGAATSKLTDTTNELTRALANPVHRGQWGERMAEDVLRLAGFVEGVNYHKQSVTASGSRPDFVFPLPTGPRVNMDVKFPLANYLRFLQSEGTDADAHRSAFLRDVRQRLKEVTTRDYIDPADGTIDFVLVFIPNEQVYRFIHETDPNLLDEAMRGKIVLCSPLTLFAILAVIRQAVDQFRLQRSSDEILSLLGQFRKQWKKYGSVVDRLGGRLESALKAYQELTTTRTRMLDRQLDRIDALQRDHEQLDDDAPAIESPEDEQLKLDAGR